MWYEVGTSGTRVVRIVPIRTTVETNIEAWGVYRIGGRAASQKPSQQEGSRRASTPGQTYVVYPETRPHRATLRSPLANRCRASSRDKG